MKRAVALIVMTAAAAATATVAGCGGTGGPFEAGSGTAPLACMRHQPHTPDAHYTDDTARSLTLLRYYTSNGARPYCDHRPSTSADRAWARLYVRLNANPKAVAAILR